MLLESQYGPSALLRFRCPAGEDHDWCVSETCGASASVKMACNGRCGEKDQRLFQVDSTLAAASSSLVDELLAALRLGERSQGW